MQLHCDVPDAVVWIDGRMVGRVDEVRGGIRMPAGRHRLEVRHDRHHTRYLELELARGETRPVEIRLAEVLD